MRVGGWGVMAMAALLSACGGGGGGGAEAPAPAPPPAVPPLSAQCESNSVARLDTETLAAGRTGELHLVACGSGSLSRIQWTGPAGLPLLSARSPSLSVLPSQAGPQRFAVSFVDAQGRAHSGSVELNASAPAATRAVLTRGEPSGWAGDRLSLRAWPQGLSETELLGSRWRWTQVSGPALSLSDTEQARLLLTAPAVSQDQLVVLRATLTLADGSSLSDEFRLLIQPVPGLAAAPLFSGSNAASRTYPYLADGPHAAALARCVYSPSLSSSPNNLCRLSELPLLGQASSNPTIEQILQRLVVSHDWQAEVFERFLREQDPSGDFRRLLAATTAVVIGGRIRPAFYWSATGAIYLDAAYLWLTPEQRDTISEAPDPRSAFGLDLLYSSPWRYVKDNRHATPARPVAERGTRTLDEIKVELGRLLYHELAHANDFLPPRSHASLDRNQLVYLAVPSNSASEQLRTQLPFFSQEMLGLGRVLFFGDPSTPTQRAYSPADVVQFFSQDRVNDDYSYALPANQTVPREDAAMLVEEAMVQLRYGVFRDIAITPRIPEGGTAADAIVSWGQRGRIGEATIRPRLRLVMAELMPWVPASELDRLAAPLPLRAGLSWGANLDQAALAAGQVRPLSAAAREREAELELERRRLRH